MAKSYLARGVLSSRVHNPLKERKHAPTSHPHGAASLRAVRPPPTDNGSLHRYYTLADNDLRHIARRRRRESTTTRSVRAASREEIAARVGGLGLVPDRMCKRPIHDRMCCVCKGSVGPWSNPTGRGLRRVQTADLYTMRPFTTSAPPGKHGPTEPLLAYGSARPHGRGSSIQTRA